MPAPARLSASKIQSYSLHDAIQKLKAQEDVTLSTMTHALEEYRERAKILDVLHDLFPRHAARTLRKALRQPLKDVYEQLFGVLLDLVNTHYFPVDGWDLDFALGQFPLIPISAQNYDEESDFEGTHLATKIAATIAGCYGQAPSWQEIQQELGPTILLPTCFTNVNHTCHIDLEQLTALCQQHPHPVSGFPTLIQILLHETGTLFLDLSYCYDNPDHGYHWGKEDILELTRQWAIAKDLMDQWTHTAKTLDAQPQHWHTIFRCWQDMCTHPIRTDS